MITEYNNTNEILFVETKLGNYSRMAYQEELDSQEEEVTKEVLLVLCSPPTDLTDMPQSIEILVESENDESNDDGNLGLLDGFQEFIKKCAQDQLSLGERMDFQELLFPSWCKSTIIPIQNLNASFFNQQLLMSVAKSHRRRNPEWDSLTIVMLNLCLPWKLQMQVCSQIKMNV